MKFIVILIVALCVLTQAAPATGVDSLLALHLNAIGGEENVSAITSYRGYADVVYMGLHGKIEVLHTIPNKIRMNTQIGPMTQKLGCDGLTVWSVDASGLVRVMSFEEQKPLINTLYLMSFSYLIPNRIPGENLYAGISTMEGVDYHKIGLYPEGGDSLFIFLHPETHYIDYRLSYETGLILLTKIINNQRLNNVVWAWDESVTCLNGPISINSTTDSAFFNVRIPDSVFNMPGHGSIDYHFPEGFDSLVIPFEQVNRHIYLDAKINGLGPFKFLLDSGAGKSLISKRVAESLNVHSTGDIPVRGIGGFGNISFGKIDSISLGQLSLYQKNTVIADLSAFTGGPTGRLDGILGFDFFVRLPLAIDFNRQELTLYNPLQNDSRDLQLHDFELYNNTPLVQARIDGKPIRLLLDLGAQSAVLLRKGTSFFESFAELQNMEYETGSMLGIGGVSEVRAVTLDSLNICGQTVFSPKVLWHETGEDLPFPSYIEGIVGLEILDKFKLYINYQREVLSIN
ncbi:MAG: retropepsin-like domain-containing protein [candidate division Zixibacteria bacterium]|nr:retropepsin-like domain-containing protein [candidate division Zixibacteria bacterium]